MGALSELLVDPFQVPYMQRALVEALLLGGLAGAVGVAVVLRRLAFYGEALTHTVFPGIVVAHLLDRSLFLGALAFGLLSAVVLTGLGSSRRVSADAGIAILLTSFFAVGVVLVSRLRTYAADLTAFLFGSLLTVDRAAIVETAVVGAIVLLALGLTYKELLLRAFDPVAATAMGYRTALLDLLLNACVALVVVAALKAVGTMLVLALLIIPAATARLLTGRVGSMLLVSTVLGALAGGVGLTISYRASLDYGLRLGAGATIVVVLVAVFVACVAGRALLRRARPPLLTAGARRSGPEAGGAGLTAT
jgi:manganese/iron transport system permease protein